MKKIALTCGDPAGVGPEIIERWLAENPEEAQNVTAIGPKTWLDSLPCEGIAVGEENFEITPGAPSEAGQCVALAAMERAAAGTRDGEFSAVVTAPVNKAGLKSIGYEFPGQTEFFAARWGGVPVMAFAGGKLSVVLATWHIPLRDVPAALTEETLSRAVEQASFLARKTGEADSGRFALGEAASRRVSCSIGVGGLNPHAGEQGILGREEIEIIEPVLEKLRSRFPGLSHCVPADTIFARQLRGEFDVVVALYHDQALAPLKTVEFDEAVNISLGLPFIRTSPDHGTAYDIAGKGIAQIRSFANAVKMAKILSS
ncbi:MAG: 4-hydroxythreonine-4-phosphate dehydrogenase PdxA [Opitutales bacterium]|nr:4-hydroxythreonine-4-phosphate dehydrogenase PdxA [Opitutales bacterium]